MVTHSARALRAALASLALALALLIPAASAHAAGTTIATDGNNPGLAVDENGNGHIAFYSSTVVGGVTKYDYSYCRLPRGGSACAIRTRLATPGNATPFGRAQVFVEPGRLIVIGDVLGGSPSSSGIWAWISTNNGTTFAAPKLIADDISINKAVMNPGSNEIHIVNAVSTGGVDFVTGSTTGPPGTHFAIGAQDGLDAYAYTDVGLLNSTTPYVVMTDGDNVYLKIFDATKTGYNTPASWKPAQKIDNNLSADSPSTASGPTGSFMVYKKADYINGGYPLSFRRINDDGTVSAAQAITPDGASAIFPDIYADGLGRVDVAYVDNHDDNKLKYVWSKRGVTFSDPITLGDADGDNFNLQVSTASDGGGWIVTDSNNNNSAIRVYTLDPKGDADPSPTPKPGPPGSPPPAPTPAPLPCPAQITVAPNVKAMVRTADCFKNPDGKGKVFTTTGSVRVNGIDFVAPASGTFTVDTVAHTVKATGPYKTSAGAIALAQGSLTWDVTQINNIPDLSVFGVKLFGFLVDGKADVTFGSTGAQIGINVDLPSPLDGVRGQSILHTTMASGLVTTDVHVTATTIPIGPLEIRDLDVTYTGANDQLEGKADFYLPPAAKKAVSASFGFQAGKFTHAELEAGEPLPPFPLPIWAAPPILLNRVGLAVDMRDGFKIAGGVDLTVGKKIAGLSAVEIDALPSSGGGASFFIPKDGSYAELAMAGKLKIIDIPIAYGKVNLRTDGPLTFQGGTDLDFDIVKIHVLMEGGVNLSNADFYAAGEAGTCLDFIDFSGCANVKGIFSSIGVAACGSISAEEHLTGIKFSIGLGLDRPWNGSIHLGDCAFDKYKPASLSGSGARASQLAHREALAGQATLMQAPGGQTLVLPGGDERGVVIRGNGSIPGFTFAGPGGRTITVPAGTTQPRLAASVAAVPIGPDAIELQVKNPAGSWTLTPEAGSTIASVETAAQLPTPKLSAKVGKTGGRGRQITVKAGNLGSQQLLIQELLPGGAAHQLGTIKGNGTKTLKFTPADAAAGKRVIQAVVVANGRQVASPQIATYSAPGPAKLAAPKTVTLKRSSTAVTVKWKKVTGADHYRVRVIASDGRLQVLTPAGKATTQVVPGVTGDDNVQIKVSAVSKVGVEGKSRAATSKPVKKKAAPKKKATKKK